MVRHENPRKDLHNLISGRPMRRALKCFEAFDISLPRLASIAVIQIIQESSEAFLVGNIPSYRHAACTTLHHMHNRIYAVRFYSHGRSIADCRRSDLLLLETFAAPSLFGNHTQHFLDGGNSLRSFKYPVLAHREHTLASRLLFDLEIGRAHV